MSRRKIPRNVRKLRGYLAEWQIKPLEIARHYGSGNNYIGMVLREYKAVSAETLEKIIAAIEAVEKERRDAVHLPAGKSG